MREKYPDTKETPSIVYKQVLVKEIDSYGYSYMTYDHRHVYTPEFEYDKPKPAYPKQGEHPSRQYPPSTSIL